MTTIPVPLIFWEYLSRTLVWVTLNYHGVVKVTTPFLPACIKVDQRGFSIVCSHCCIILYSVVTSYIILVSVWSITTTLYTNDLKYQKLFLYLNIISTQTVSHNSNNITKPLYCLKLITSCLTSSPNTIWSIHLKQ